MKDYLKPLWITPQLRMLPTSLIKLKVAIKNFGGMSLSDLQKQAALNPQSRRVYQNGVTLIHSTIQMHYQQEELHTRNKWVFKNFFTFTFLSLTPKNLTSCMISNQTNSCIIRMHLLKDPWCGVSLSSLLPSSPQQKHRCLQVPRTRTPQARCYLRISCSLTFHPPVLVVLFQLLDSKSPGSWQRK